MSFSMSPFPLRFGSRQGGGGEPWTPLALPSLIAWRQPGLSNLFQDAAGTTPAVADDPVGLITDLASVGPYPYSQSTAGNRPAYKAAGGKHWLEYDGSTDVMSAAGNIAFTTTTVGIACRLIAATGTHYIVSNETGGGTTYYILGSSTAFSFCGTAVTVTGGTIGADCVVIGTWSSTTRTLYVNDETPVSTTIAAPTADWRTEGARRLTGLSHANVRIYGSTYFNTALTGSDLADLKSYLQSLLPGF